ncbi:MAG: nicotinate-nicotinamide nucleotide adenylyltransferase [Bryobacteraceae bacterium]
MEFIRRAAGNPSSLAILPGSFNPPTRAHLALAGAGLEHADEVLLVLPRLFPHKRYEGASLEDRLRMVQAAIEPHPRFSLGVSESGLFKEIAEECRQAYGSDVRLKLLCGRDAAERFLHWDYGRPGAVKEMLEAFELLVAPRRGPFVPPKELRDRVRTLPLPAEYDPVSASEIRRRIQVGEPWEHLVPVAAVPLARSIYRQ